MPDLDSNCLQRLSADDKSCHARSCDNYLLLNPWNVRVECKDRYNRTTLEKLAGIPHIGSMEQLLPNI